MRRVLILLTVFTLNGVFCACAAETCNNVSFGTDYKMFTAKLNYCISEAISRNKAISSLVRENDSDTRNLALYREGHYLASLKADCLLFLIDQQDILGKYGKSCSTKKDFADWKNEIIEAKPLFNSD